MLSSFIFFNVVYSWMYKSKSGKMISADTVLLRSSFEVMGNEF